jgi:hypothetical protein
MLFVDNNDVKFFSCHIANLNVHYFAEEGRTISIPTFAVNSSTTSIHGARGVEVAVGKAFEDFGRWLEPGTATVSDARKREAWNLAEQKFHCD